MKYTITLDLDEYDDAKYIMGAASLLQSVEEDNSIKDFSSWDVPVAMVLLRTINLAGAWLKAALDENDAENVFGISSEMQLSTWAAAFSNMRHHEKIFLQLVNSSDRWRKSYRELSDELAKLPGVDLP